MLKLASAVTGKHSSCTWLSRATAVQDAPSGHPPTENRGHSGGSSTPRGRPSSPSSASSSSSSKRRRTPKPGKPGPPSHAGEADEGLQAELSNQGEASQRHKGKEGSHQEAEGAHREGNASPGEEGHGGSDAAQPPGKQAAR